MRANSIRSFAAAVAVSALALAGSAASAAPGDDPDAADQLAMLEGYWDAAATRGVRQAVLTDRLLAAAEPDECFAGVGEPYPSGTYGSEGNLECPEGSQPKVNQAYVWGLTKSGDDLWWGTGPNILCLVFSTYLQTTSPNLTDSWVCEGEAAWYRSNNPLGTELPAQLGDWRPPDLFVLDQAGNTLTDLVPRVTGAGVALLNTTLGIRSAGSIDDRVFFAGPNFSGLTVLVFDTDGSYIGAENLPFTNIRKWVAVGGELYTGVGTGTGGAILRYTGSSPTDPFQYEVVGRMAGGEPAELVEHDGRIFATTWPIVGQGYAGLWMSPELGADGLTAGDEDGWQSVWSVTDYEPDPVTAATYGGGALASYGGQLYWGTMHVPLTSALAHSVRYADYYAEAGVDASIAAILGSTRAISIFRGDDFDSNAKVELLYGAAELPVFDPVTESWGMRPNNMGADPAYGRSGFGNPFNNYTWTMAAYGGSLYVGTMDWSYLLTEGLAGALSSILDELDIPAGTAIPLPRFSYGADLWRFDAPGRPAVAERTDGVGNYLSYGIRTMVSDDALYLGMANPMNLMTDPGDAAPEGGWQLLRLTPLPENPPGGGDPPPGGSEVTTVRVWGDDRYETAVAASQSAFPHGAGAVFIASGADFPDALAGGPAAASEEGPILLVRPDSVPASVLAEIERLDPTEIYVLGGPSAVDAGVATTLAEYGAVERLAGPDRYGTAVAVSDRFWSSSGTVFLAVGTQFADALTGGSAAAKTDAPVLLTRSGSLPKNTADELKALDPEKVVLLGGTAAISDAVKAAVGALMPGAKVERVSGPDRYGTSREAIEAFWPRGSDRVYVATGADFADALAGVPLAATNGESPVLLTKPECAPAATSAALEHLDASHRVLLGGPAAIADGALGIACPN